MIILGLNICVEYAENTMTKEIKSYMRDYYGTN